MDRVNLFFFFESGEKLRAIKTLQKDQNAFTQSIILMEAQSALEKMLNSESISLSFSRDRGEKVLKRIEALIARLDEHFASDGDSGPSEGLPETSINGLKAQYDRFEQFFAEEISRASVYAVSPKGIYATSELIEKADHAIPERLRSKLSDECRKDLQHAGRCLAFEVPTAAGFHTMRALESAMLLYWDFITSSKPKPVNRNWGTLIKGLTDAGASPKILAVLTQLKDLHRNPLVHPESVLTTDEALTLWYVTIGALVAMMEVVTSVQNSIEQA